MLKKCTPLWREAHFQVTRSKTHRGRTTFGSWDVEKVHAVVARSTFPSQNVQSTPGSDHFGNWDVEKVHAVVARSTFRSQKCEKLTGSEHFWKLRCRKSARRCGAKHNSKSKVQKNEGCGALLDVQIVLRGRRKGLCTLSKVSKMRRFCSMSKNDGRRGTFEEDLQRCIFRGRRSTRDMFIRAVRRSGPWFPERGCILERQIFRFAEMILRDRCNNLYDLASRFPGRRSTLDRWSGKIAKSIGTRPSALHSTFHFWRKSRRIVSFLMLSTSKIFRFWCCQAQKLRKSRRIVSFLSRRIASFWMLPSSKIEEVSQKLTDRQTDRQTGRQAGRQTSR